MAFRLGSLLGWLCWKLLDRRRAVVLKNLEVVNAWMAGRGDRPGSSAQWKMPLELQVREVFLRAGANLIAGFPLSRLSPERMEQHLEILGIEHLREALAEGTGAIVLLAHMGPWEALAHLPNLASKHGIEAPLGAMYRPLNNAYLDAWVRLQRESMGTRLFSRRDGFHKPVDFLRAGGTLGVLADQKMRQGEKVPYFGVEVSTSPIPGLFHRRSGAPLLALSIETIAPTRWRLNLRPVEIPASVDPASRAAMATLANQALEESLAQSPCDGFWLHKRF